MTKLEILPTFANQIVGKLDMLNGVPFQELDAIVGVELAEPVANSMSLTHPF